MTKEELDKLKALVDRMKSMTNAFINGEQAVLDKAIKALDQEPCDDAISREAVLDLCDSKDEEYKVRHFREDVECLPSVHPECTEDYCPAAFKPVECEDCISRQAVLELVADYDLSMGQVVKCIHALPSVTPAEKVGRWINHKDEHQCSQCREIVIADKDIWEEYPYDYCPNCGAKMEVEG